MILVALLVFIALTCTFFYLITTVAGNSQAEHLSFSGLILAITFGFLFARIYYVDGDSLRNHYRRAQLKNAQEAVESYQRALESEKSK